MEKRTNMAENKKHKKLKNRSPKCYVHVKIIFKKIVTLVVGWKEMKSTLLPLKLETHINKAIMERHLKTDDWESRQRWRLKPTNSY